MAGSLCQLYLSKRGHRQAERAPVSRLLIACVHQQVVLLPKNVIFRWILRQHRRILLREAEQGAVECCYLLGWCLHSRCRSESSTSSVRAALLCSDHVKWEYTLLFFLTRDHLHCVLHCFAIFLEVCSNCLEFCGEQMLLFLLVLSMNITPCTVCKEERSLFQSLMNAIIDCLHTWRFFFFSA